MIVKRGAVEPTQIEGSSRRSELRLADAGGLTQFGAHLVTLDPGDRSASRHWHAEEDEFLYLVEGEAIVVEDDGEHVLQPGDAACWPAGVPNAHYVLNRSGAPLTYLIVGTRPETDRVRYPDEGETLFHEPPTWRLVADDGTVRKSGKT